MTSTFFTVYVNGTEVPHDTSNTDNSMPQLVNMAPTVYIGKHAVLGRHYAGRLEEISIWSIALNAAQATAAMRKKADGRVRYLFPCLLLSSN